MNIFYLLDIDKNAIEMWTAIGTVLLAVMSFVAILVQIWWNRRILRESNENARSQLNLLSNQLKDGNENSNKY
jgi:hypothetical protein